MKNKIYAFIALLAAATLSNNSFAGEGGINQVYLQSISAIPSAVGGHVAGNFEVRIKDGFSLPSGVSCDNTTLTTLKSADPDRKLFSLLMSAQILQRPVFLYITDSAALTAFPGRCSIMAADLY